METSCAAERMIIRRSWPRQLLRSFILKTSRSEALYELARRYAEDFSGEFNPDINTNGELRVLRAILEASGANPVALDVGANKGEWLQAALATREDVFVHAFEPCAGSFKNLEKSGFSPKRVKLNQVAVGAEKGIARLNVFGPDSELNSLLHRADQNGCSAQQEVEVTTIDDYCASNHIKRIAFLKIDVEGFEPRALNGAARSFQSESIDAAQFEYGEAWIAARAFLKDVIEWVKPLPYDLYKITPHCLARVRSYQFKLENFRMSNYLLLRRGLKFEGIGPIREA